MRISSPPPPRSFGVTSSSVTASARKPQTAPALPRSPEQAVAFTRAFNARLNLPPQRLKEKEALLRTSASSFFRAMPALFHDDLRGPWREAAQLLGRPAPQMPVVGDMHIGNLGTLRGPEGKAVWGLNDFDQAAVGSPEVDLTRLATSAVLTAREAGLGSKVQDKAVEALAQAYFGELRRLAQGGDNPGPFLSKKEASGAVQDLISDARDASPKDLLKKYCRTNSQGEPRFQNTDSLRPVSADTRAALQAALGPYEAKLPGSTGVALPLEVLDWAQRLDAGGSSYGLDRYYALVRAKDPKQPPVILEIKELLAPSLPQPPVAADGASVVQRQTQLGADFNPLTGSARVGGRPFLVRELEPEKGALDSKALDEDKEVVSAFAQAGVVLARAHGATREQAQALMQWVGGDEPLATQRLVSFANGYADQTQADWSAFRAAK